MPGAAHGLIGTVDPPLGSDLFEVDEHALIAAQISALTDGRLQRLG